MTSGYRIPITTDDKGRWRLEMLPLSFKDTDSIFIDLAHPEYISDVGPPARRVPAPEDLRNQSAVMVMARGLPLRGTVLGDDGKPVKDAAVSLSWKPSDRYVRNTAKTDKAGRFAFENARPGKQAICVQANRFAPALEEIVVGPGLKPMTIRLHSGRVVAGHVVDNEGQSVAGVQLGVARWRDREVLDWEAKTDAQGRFRWRTPRRRR